MYRPSRFESDMIARRISQHCQPVITEDVEAATVYSQSWQHQSGSPIRGFDVIALDEQMAEEMGGIRLRERHHENILDWKLVKNRPYAEPPRHLIIAVLTYEDPDETQLREEAFKARRIA